MFNREFNRRKLLALAALALLAGCKVIPSGPPGPATPTQPSPDSLPTDTQRHRIALLVPLTGANAGVGQSIANAATMALLDTNSQNLRVTTYDTATGAESAASKAVSDGNSIILGPLLAEDIPAVATAAAKAKLPVISFSNDATAASRGIYVMGNLPGQSVERSVGYAASQGIKTFAALIPRGEYGQHSSNALMAAARASGASVVAMETYDRSNASVDAAARKLRDKGGFQAVLIADGGRIASRAATLLRPADAAGPSRIIGTELWSGESAVTTSPALRGALFASVADTRFRQFADSYKSRFGAQPYRIATLGYDAVLLTLRVARDWKPGSRFPASRMLDRGGFLGLDGAFRFRSSGVIERALEVREVRAGGVDVVSPAPSRFAD